MDTDEHGSELLFGLRHSLVCKIAGSESVFIRVHPWLKNQGYIGTPAFFGATGTSSTNASAGFGGISAGFGSVALMVSFAFTSKTKSFPSFTTPGRLHRNARPPKLSLIRSSPSL